MKTLVTRTLFSLFILTIAAPCAVLFAQQAAEKKAEEKQKVTEELTVTARKQEEAIQEVPLSVAAPTEAQLRDRGAETLEDVSTNVAGFTVQNVGPGQSQVGMRGVSAGRIIRDQPGVKEQVGVYLDESVISLSLFTPDIDLFDLSRVEVLRGPQGTLFGSGSLAGTVRYITNQPKLGVQESIADLSVSAIGSGGVGGGAKYAGNVPIGDKAAMRVVGYYTRYGGYIDAVHPGGSVTDDYNDGHRAGGRLAFRFQPNEKLTITPRILYQDVDIKGWNRFDDFNILANPYTTTRPKVTLGDHKVYQQVDEPFTDKFLLGDFNLEYDFGAATLTAITSYSDRDILAIKDATPLTASITGGSIALPEAVYTIGSPLFDKTDAKSFTQEVRFSGNTAQLKWVGGAFYSDSEKDYGQNLPVIGFEETTFATAGVRIPTAGTKLALKDELYKSALHYDFKQLAVFGEMTYSIMDLDLSAGLRWYDFDEDRTQVFDGIFSDPIDSVGSVSADGFAPRVIVSYKINPETRLNAQISKGFRLGGINDPLNVPLCTAADLATYGGRPTWEDETLWNYEVGAKTTVMGGRGTFNGAVYYMDIENLQVPVTAGSCSSRINLNVPKARSAGVEAEFEVAPSPNFDFAVSGNYNNSELESSFLVNNQVVAAIKEGNRLPSVPEFQFSAAATLRRPMMGTRVGYVTGVFQHVGDRYTQVGDQDPTFGRIDLTSFAGDIGGPYTQNIVTFDPKLPAYNILNLRVGLLHGKWDTALFVNNVTDERAFLALDIERGSRARVSYMTNQPRTFGVSTRINF